ncbi:MAG: hypothetical protein H8E91_01830 [Planctomycetes bacterium]|nr:hypothetical protein [Planctomycetota bacterium]
MQHNHLNNFALVISLVCALSACSSTQNKNSTHVTEATKQEALQSLRASIKPATDAVVMSSNDIDWPIGSLPWDRFTLPVISPDGTNAAVQLGPSVPTQVLTGTDASNLSHTVIELHRIDPANGNAMQPIVVKQRGLLLGRNANNERLLVEAPRGNAGRWVGEIDWDTGKLRWLVSDDSINAFPTLNRYGDIAWSRQLESEERFHIVVKTATGQRVIDDGKSDWLMPSFAVNDRLNVYRLKNGSLSLVNLDLHARDPLLTASSLLLIESGATREQAWQIATTNPANPKGLLVFYHPLHQRMTVWQPGKPLETVYLARDSVAAAPVADGSWLVATSDRMIRQELGADEGIHLRNKLAVPVATTSTKWTHLMLVPDGNRLQVRAVNVE